MNIAPPISRRRRHTPEFKQALVALCRPGVSTSAVALAHGVNANLLRRWIKQFPPDSGFPVAPAPVKLVPVQIETVNTSRPDGDIRLNIQRGATRINISWPVAGAEACAGWLGAWLK